MADVEVKNKRGIHEFVLGGEVDTKLLDARVYDDKIKLAAYGKQTSAAGAVDTSSCPMCATVSNNNSARIYDLDEVDADHVTAWTISGARRTLRRSSRASTRANCEMLCVSHNRSKGDR